MTIDRTRHWAEKIEAARVRTLAWLATMQAEGLPRGVTRISPAHDAVRWPGVLLPGTYNAVMCLDLLGGLDDWSDDERRALVGWLEGHRADDGVFHLPGMAAADTFKKPDADETRSYIDWHQIGRAHV
jgi:prenyltransferase beta subunit